MNDKKKIALIGGRGKGGRYVAEKALEKGHTVRMLVRSLDMVEASKEGHELIKGDARDISAIRELLNGCDVVINTMGQTKGDDSAFSTVTSNILTVMKELSIKRYIVITGGVVDAKGDKKDFASKAAAALMRLVYSAFVKDRQKELDLLIESDIDWTLIRLPIITEEAYTGKVKESLICVPGTKINNRDLAGFIIREIEDKRYIYCCPFVAS